MAYPDYLNDLYRDLLSYFAGGWGLLLSLSPQLVGQKNFLMRFWFFNCCRTKFEAIIVNMSFYLKLNYFISCVTSSRLILIFFELLIAVVSLSTAIILIARIQELRYVRTLLSQMFLHDKSFARCPIRK